MLVGSTALRRSRAWLAAVGLLAVIAAGCTPSPTNPNPNPDDGLASAPTVTPTTLPSGALQYSGVRYGTTSNWQQLDLYVPAGTGPFPLVVWFHGGYWTQGSRSLLDTGFRDALLADGYAVATAGYRLAALGGVNLWPAGLLDAKLSVKFLQTYAGQLDLDAARVVTSGHSAGGHLAVMVAITRDDAGVRLNSGDPAVRGAFAFGAPMDIPLATSFNPLAALAVAVLMACSGDTCDSSRMQPAPYLDAADPPVKLIVSTGDALVPPATVNPMVAKANEVGYGSLSVQTFTGLDHDAVYQQAPTPAYLPWLDAVL